MKEFVNKIVSLDNIRQWEERDSVIKESVSQHSFKVSAICVFLLEKVKDFPSQFIEFKLKCVEYSILHDFDESILGRDISHVVKYNEFNGSDIRETLDEFVEHSLQKIRVGIIYLIVLKTETLRRFVNYAIGLDFTLSYQEMKPMGVKTFETERVLLAKHRNKKELKVKKY